ncbi:hypothetical protein G6F37_002702 [Rhizopus arrhizus]|jgi:hypothetical protein|nr:hypothetical protein G6F38_006713 [Rhizopus arrhizus]KAG1161843.1 hypothetical protein G6F37_002702 [Rhizopus arrhizus]
MTRIVDKTKKLQTLQDTLDDLRIGRESIEIIFMSLKNAFSIYPDPEWEEINEEICREYDDLMAQVRRLDRCLKKLDKSIKSL